MHVIVRKPFGIYSPGAEIPEMPEGQAEILIRRGLVKEKIAEPTITQSVGSYEDWQMKPAFAKPTKRRPSKAK